MAWFFANAPCTTGTTGTIWIHARKDTRARKHIRMHTHVEHTDTRARKHIRMHTHVEHTDTRPRKHIRMHTHVEHTDTRARSTYACTRSLSTR